MEGSEYLQNDCIVLRCTVGVVVSKTNGSKPYLIDFPPVDMGTDFGALLDSGEGTDVTFEVEGETFKAHKLVLAARSPVFKAQLCGLLRESNTENIPVTDVKAAAFRVGSFP